LIFFLEISISLIQLNEKNRQMSSSSTMSTLPTTATNSTTTVDGGASTITVKSPTDEKQIPIGKFFGKIFYAKVPAGFVPGSVARVKDEELKTDPFRVMGMVNEIAIESNVERNITCTRDKSFAVCASASQKAAPADLTMATFAVRI
jgi:hypothetical protein